MKGFHVFHLRKHAVVVWAVGILAIAWLVIGCGGGGTSSQMSGTQTGTVMVSISDPPSCKNPNGSFAHVYVTIQSVQAHIDPNATNSSSGWQELAPQLANQAMQIDLFSTAQTNCVLAQLGSADLPVGSYQQIRLLLVANSASGTGIPRRTLVQATASIVSS